MKLPLLNSLKKLPQEVQNIFWGITCLVTMIGVKSAFNAHDERLHEEFMASIETVPAPQEQNDFADRAEADNAHIPDSVVRKGEAAIIDYENRLGALPANKQDMDIDHTYSTDAVNTFNALYNNSADMGVAGDDLTTYRQYKNNIFSHFPHLEKLEKRRGHTYIKNITLRTQLIKGDHEINNGSLQLSRQLKEKLAKCEKIRKEQGNAQGDQAFFKVQREVFKDKEETHLHVYKDNNGFMTVGTGYNLQKPGAKKEWDSIFKGKLNYNDVLSGKTDLTVEQEEQLYAATAGKNGTYTTSFMSEINQHGVDINQMGYEHRMGLMLIHYHASGLFDTNPKTMGKALKVMCDKDASTVQKNKAALEGPGEIYKNYIYNTSNKNSRNKVGVVNLHGRAQLVFSLLAQDEDFRIPEHVLVEDIQHRMRAHGQSTNEVNVILIGELPDDMTRLTNDLKEIDFEGKTLNIYGVNGHHIQVDDNKITYSTPESRQNKAIHVASLKTQ